MKTHRHHAIISSKAPVLDEYVLLGLLSSAKSYKLVWVLNRILNIRLTKYQNKSFASVFPFYAYDDQNESYRLIGNQTYDTVSSDAHPRWVSKKLVGVDYLFLVKSAWTKAHLLTTLRSCSLIRYVFSIQQSALNAHIYACI